MRGTRLRMKRNRSFQRASNVLRKASSPPKLRVRGVKIDRSGFKKFARSVERGKRASLYWQGGYARREARSQFRSRRRTWQNDAHASRNRSKPGEVPMTWSRHKQTGGKVSYPMTKIRFALDGESVVIGSQFHKRAKNATRATTPSVHEHGGTVWKKERVVMRTDALTGRSSRMYSERQKQRRLGAKTQTQKDWFRNQILDQQILINKDWREKENSRVKLPPRPFMKPVIKKLKGDSKFKRGAVSAFARRMR